MTRISKEVELDSNSRVSGRGRVQGSSSLLPTRKISSDRLADSGIDKKELTDLPA